MAVILAPLVLTALLAILRTNSVEAVVCSVAMAVILATLVITALLAILATTSVGVVV